MRTVTVILVASILTGIIGCTNLSDDRISDEDYMVLNATLVHLFIKGPEGTEREFGYHNYELGDREIPEELIHATYVTPFLFSTSDTLGFTQPTRIELESIDDPDFKSLAKRLFDNSPETLPLTLEKITNTGLHQLQSGKRKYPRESRSVYSCSRIVYANDKACFYFEDLCRGLCGRGVLVLLEKVDGIWEIKEEVCGWVS